MAKRPGRLDVLNTTKNNDGRFPLAGRATVVVLSLTAMVLALAGVLWNARMTAPPRIDLTRPGTLALADVTVHFPIKPETIEAFYVWDGGTYGVTFVDNAGENHTVASWQPLGSPEHHGEILVGGMTPREGGRNVGRIPAAEQLIFSAMELEEQLHPSESVVVDIVYPTTGHMFILTLRRLARWIGFR